MIPKAVSGLMILFGVFFGWLVIQSMESAEEYSRHRHKAVSLLHFEERLLKAREWFFTEAEWAKRETSSAASFKSAEAAIKDWNRISAWFIAGSAVYLTAVAMLTFRHASLLGYLGMSCALIAFACLVNGILTPSMEISAFHTQLTVPLRFKSDQVLNRIKIPSSITERLPEKLKEADFSKVFPGRTFYFYQIKSVQDLIRILVQERNWFVAISILIFSVLIPAVKLFLTVGSFFSPAGSRFLVFSKKADSFGKWSMADVFVMALFLGFLSFRNLNGGFETEVHTLPGMYFFAGYCVLGMIASQLTLSARNAQSGRKALQSE